MNYIDNYNATNGKLISMLSMKTEVIAFESEYFKLKLSTKQ